jgi:lipopolysaccharide transport system permease protein
MNDELPISIIRPSKWWTSLDLRQYRGFRYLMKQLVRREVVLRYRQTALGVVWVVLQPLLTAVILTVVFAWVRSSSPTAKGLGISMAASVGWVTFSGCVARGSTAILVNANLVRKVHFPRIFLPVASSGAVLVDTAVGAGAAAVVLAVVGFPVTWRLVLVIPALAGVFVFGTSLAIAMSGLSAKYRDVQFVVPFLLQVLAFASPIAYTATQVSSSATTFLAINPLTGWLSLLRSAVSNEPIPVSSVAISVSVSAIMLVASLLIFAKTERAMADLL